MRARILASVILLTALNGTSAIAADLRLKARPAAAFSWAGWYVGVNGGFGWADPSATFTPAAVPLPPTGVVDVAAPPFSLSNAPKGPVAGGQIGYNWQFGRFVAGVELDFDWAHLVAQSSGSFVNQVTVFGDAGILFGTPTLDSRMDWFTTLRARFGYAFDRLLPYVTAGAALAHLKSTVSYSYVIIDAGGLVRASLANSSTVSDTLWGLALGGGLDWAIDQRWILRGEYLYLRFPDKIHNDLLPGVTSVNNSMDTHIARIALNYRFVP